MIEDLLFYTAVYVSLYVSVFWLMIFAGSKHRKLGLSKLPSLSIIIPAYNEEQTLEKCVHSLKDQQYPGLKIIIVDDGSTDNTRKLGRGLAEKYPFVRYIRKPNKGKAAALNTGLSELDTEYFGFIDADTFLSDNALKNMVRYFTAGPAAVIAAVKPAQPKNLVERMQKIEYVLASFTRKLMSFLDSLYYTPGFAIYRTEVIRKVGGFDEENFTEDLEIGLRLKSAGYSIENTIDDCAYTVVPKTLRELFDQRMRWYRGHIYNSKKYSHMFFSRKYGSLGMFILPMQYVLLALTSPLLLLGVYEFAGYVSKNMVDVRLVGYDVAYFLETADITLLTPVTFFILAMLGAFLLIMKVSQQQVREKITAPEYVLYMLVYPFINLFLWIAAFTQEMTRAKKKW